jgi:hypothetical protein
MLTDGSICLSVVGASALIAVIGAVAATLAGATIWLLLTVRARRRRDVGLSAGDVNRSCARWAR